LKFRFPQGLRCKFNFYRDSSGNEVDIVYNVGGSHLPIEIKAGETISSNYFKGLNNFEKYFPQLPFGKAVIYAGSQYQIRNRVKIRNYKSMLTLFKNIK